MGKLFRRLAERAARGTLRGHMPGHKGVPLLGVAAESIDFTELSDTGNLYDSGENIIREAERDAALAAGAELCVYSAGGSTLLVQGMLGVAARRASEKGRSLRVLAARDAHRAFFAALGLLGGEVEWIYPKYNGAWNIAEGICTGELRAALREGEYDAVYLTSPNYYGVMSDLAGISGACAEAGVLLLIDAAHGAHLVWDGELFGIDRRCEFLMALSAHKTLGSLGGGAFALGGGGVSRRDMLEAMQLFGSSSPSYVILASLDRALGAAASDAGRDMARRCAERVARLRESAAAMAGVSALGADGSGKARSSTTERTEKMQSGGIFSAGRQPGRSVVLDPCRFVFSIDGVSGRDAADWLERERGVVCEMADARNVVFIMTAQDGEEEFARLEAAIRGCAEALGGGAGEKARPLEMPRPERVLSVRRALLGAAESVALRSAEGRVAAEAIAPYPPGVPVVVPGEKISRKTLAFLEEIGYNVDKRVRVTPKSIV